MLRQSSRQQTARVGKPQWRRHAVVFVVAALVGAVALGPLLWRSPCTAAVISEVEVACVPIGTTFHGIPNNVPYEGGPEGSCWCGHADQYCLCTPSLSVDVVVEVVPNSGDAHGQDSVERIRPASTNAAVGIDVAALHARIAAQVAAGQLTGPEGEFVAASVASRLVAGERGRGGEGREQRININDGGEGGIVVTNRTKAPFGVALPGGFVDVGESAEAAAAREVFEETGLVLQASQLRQSQLFSDPRRDTRRAGASMSFFATVPRAPAASTGDETADVRVVPWADALALPFAFEDHRRIVAAAYARFRAQV